MATSLPYFFKNLRCTSAHMHKRPLLPLSQGGQLREAVKTLTLVVNVLLLSSKRDCLKGYPTNGCYPI